MEFIIKLLFRCVKEVQRCSRLIGYYICIAPCVQIGLVVVRLDLWASAMLQLRVLRSLAGNGLLLTLWKCFGLWYSACTAISCYVLLVQRSGRMLRTIHRWAVHWSALCSLCTLYPVGQCIGKQKGRVPSPWKLEQEICKGQTAGNIFSGLLCAP